MIRALIALFLLSSLSRAEETSAKYYEVEANRNLSYRDDKDADPIKHKLDLYLPKGVKDFPVVVFVHGGTWQHGDKKLYGPVGHLFAQQGIGTAVVNYRLTTGPNPAKHPDHIRDVAKAFAWVQSHIESFGGRKDCIFVCGHSAGGHLVSLLASDESYLKEEKLSLKDIRGVIPISGVFHINPILAIFHPIFGDQVDVCRKASPIIHVKEGLPPFLVLYAEKDLFTLDRQALDMNRKLQSKNCESEAICIKDRDHSTILIWLALSSTDPCSKAILNFVDKHAK